MVYYLSPSSGLPFIEHDAGIAKLNSEWDRRFTNLEENCL